MWGWNLFFLGQIPHLHSTTGCKDCSSTMQMERNVTGDCTRKESTLWPPDYECSTLTCWQPIKMLFENIYQSVWWDFSLKIMKTIKGMILIMVWVLFQGICFYSYGLCLSDETIWGWNKILRLCSLCLHWPRQSSWQGCYRTAFDPHRMYA